MTKWNAKNVDIIKRVDMTKEEFKTKKDIINSKIEELNNEMEKLKREYIESNVEYPRK